MALRACDSFVEALASILRLRERLLRALKYVQGKLPESYVDQRVTLTDFSRRIS